jgi:hypothetical protein
LNRYIVFRGKPMPEGRRDSKGERKEEKENRPGHATNQRAGREGELLRQQQQNVPSMEQGESKSGR